MKKFDYLNRLVDWRDLDKRLEEWGGKGWRMVNFVAVDAPSSSYRLIFIREMRFVCSDDACRNKTDGCDHSIPHLENNHCGGRCAEGVCAKCVPYTD